ncbi:tRNA epoxyqueuosine(34) reductase QueG [Leeia oryzae]|uniref:tRNA epoxyqueuosine(34) reductase QueG n=1 Tax=Leeia oryzae TaxID=356662 RepID=UPI0003A875DC|nr:tRNA epoxyqueuosine(34) reductase QueG [Leeia oryzae]
MQHENTFSTPATDLLTGLVADIKHWGLELGFSQIGIADTDLSAAEPELLAWLAKGYHGEMDYMARHGLKRARPSELLPGTVRVISARMPYLSELPADSLTQLDANGQAYISRYALGRDYHKVLKQRLEQLARKIQDALALSQQTHQYRVFTDSAPILEVALASKAGIGWRGKHTLLLTREQGSYFFLGEILTDLPLPVDAPVQPHCGSCQKCMDVCPTGAIVAPYEVDARRCISYLTIELKGSIPVEFREQIGNRVYGCDDCQLFCPWNRFAQKTTLTDFDIRHGLDNVKLLTLFEWDDATFQKQMAGSAIYRIGHEQWQRNLAIGLGNAPSSPEIIRALEAKLPTASPLVQEHIRWALDKQKAGQTPA